MARESSGWTGARRCPKRSAAHAIDDFLVLDDQPLEGKVRGVTRGRGAEVVFDTVGGPMFEPAVKSLAHRGRMLAIASTGARRVSFDLIDFYHHESQLFGVDTRARDAIASAALLEVVTPLFDQRGRFSKPPAVDSNPPLSEGVSAYEKVDRGQVRGRLVLAP